MSFLRLLV